MHLFRNSGLLFSVLTWERTLAQYRRTILQGKKDSTLQKGTKFE